MTIFRYIRRHRSGVTWTVEVEMPSRLVFLETLAAWNRVGDGVWTYTEEAYDVVDEEQDTVDAPVHPEDRMESES